MDFRDGVLHIGDVSVADLASRFGTPFYVYDAAIIRRQIDRVRRAFNVLPFRPFYAMKANGNISILRLIHEAGFGCDAVSPGEVFLARHAGFTPDQIWFTCSNVSDEDLQSLDDEQIVINVNSMSEIDRIVRLGLPNRLALRVNPDIGAGHHHDVVTGGSGVKFGLDVAELADARMIIRDAGRTIVGLHAHIGSGVTEVGPLVEAGRRLLELMPDFDSLRWVNFGGGIAAPYRPNETDFPIDRYGEELTEIADRMLRARDVTAILEPGRYITAESGTLIARVTARRISHGVQWVGCDTGFNHLVRPSKYSAYHHILNASRGSSGSLREKYDASLKREDVVVAGNICESGDVFTRENGEPVTRPIEHPAIGDLLAFCDAGAYGFSMASHYNARLLLPEILIDRGQANLIRERQKFEELLRGQRE